MRFDLSLIKNLKITERVALKFQADAFNLFNHPSFDAPNGNFALNGCFNPYPCFPQDMTQILAAGNPNPNNYGVIKQTVGSNRFLQLSVHLTFASGGRGAESHDSDSEPVAANKGDQLALVTFCL